MADAGAAATPHTVATGAQADDDAACDVLPAPLPADASDDTIARRTRTRFSLVDVPIDTLESCLPDIVEPVRVSCCCCWCR